MSKDFHRADVLTANRANVAGIGDIREVVQLLQGQVAALSEVIAGLAVVQSWEPVWLFNTSATWSVRDTYGTFVKIGELVVCQFRIGTSGQVGGSPTGPARIAGLPFPVSTSMGRSAPGAVMGRNWGTATPSIIVPEPGQSFARVLGYTIDGPVTIGDTHFRVTGVDSNVLEGSLIYIAGGEA